MDAKTETLGDALPREIARVSAKRDRWMKMAADHPEMARGMNIAIALMQQEISEGVRAAAEGDVIAMMAAYKALEGYDDDD